MQTEDKKMGKFVSLQKNLEWSTKEVLGWGEYRETGNGWESYGATAVSRNTLLGCRSSSSAVLAA